jgi:hypothetical protein
MRAPIMTYASAAWDMKKSAIALLQVQQNKLLRLMTGAPYFVPMTHRPAG